MSDNTVTIYAEIINESDDAYELDIGDECIWIGKSLVPCYDEEHGIVDVPRWWAEKNPCTVSE